ncbi:MAG TPA: hypothetical protein PKA88_38420, partial [Polyangiaceae bacterium]|nr:hypothetical protein [Polyangiaceae bacterium]
AAMVPTAIVWAGGADVMGCRVAEDEDDTSKRALITILNDWPRLTGPEGMTAKAAVDALYPVARLRGEALPDSYDDLREAIGLLVPTLAGKAPNYVRLGYVLRGFRGRVVGDKRLKSEGQKRGASLWSVVEVQR